MTVRVSFGLHRRVLAALAANFLIAAGALALGFCVWALLSGAVYQRIQKIRFAEQRPVEISGVAQNQTAPDSPALAPPSSLLAADPQIIGELEIPRIGLDVMVREGMDEDTLRKAAGHVPSTDLPGQDGDFMVLGHRDTFFRPLHAIELGDLVRLRTRRGRFAYRIDSVVVVDLEGLSLIQKAPRQGITLITCFPFDYIGPAPHRLVARGSQITVPPDWR